MATTQDVRISDDSSNVVKITSAGEMYVASPVTGVLTSDVALTLKALFYKISSPDFQNPATGNIKAEAVSGTITTVTTVGTVTTITNIPTIGSQDTSLNLNAPLNNLLFQNQVRFNIS